MSDINLLPQRKRGLFSEERMLLIAKVSAVALIILVVSLSILFFILSRDPTLNTQKADEAQTLAALTILQSKTAKYLIVLDRIQKIKTVTKKQSHFDSSMGDLLGQIPPSVLVTGFALDQTSLTLSVSSADLSVIGTTIDNFTKFINEKKILKSLTIQGLVTDEKNGKFVLTLTGDLL